MKNRILKDLSVANDHTLKLARSFLSDLESPLVDSLDKGDYLALVNAPFPNPLESDFPRAYAARELLRKYPFKINGVDREAAARKSFLAAEATCGVQNYQWANLRADPHRAPVFLEKMREKIRIILGKFHWEAASAHCGFGKGATYSLQRRHGDAYYKFGSKTDVTFAALPVAEAMLKWACPLWHQDLTSGGSFLDAVTLVPGNRVTFVPKDALKDRTIAIEPNLNMFLQKGIGGLIRSRLKALGLNLNDQQPHNQRLAFEGSCTDLLATIDLSSASDSVSLSLVEFLLPPDWFQAIMLTRSAYGVLPDRSLIAYEKVSSMGNGFTFELETLIFLACVLVHVPRPRVNVNVAVYGDDIICPSDNARAVIRSLDCMGFTPNLSKTFYAGPFRESCGKHYLNGADVTPLFVKEGIDTPPRLYWFANQVRRFSRLHYGLDSRYRNTWDLTVSCLPRTIRYKFLISDGMGDNGLVVDSDFALSRSARFCRETWQLRSFSFAETGVSRILDDSRYLLRSLFNLERSAGHLPPVVNNGLVEIHEYVPGLKPASVRYKRCYPLVREWSHHGPWL